MPAQPEVFKKSRLSMLKNLKRDKLYKKSFVSFDSYGKPFTDNSATTVQTGGSRYIVLSTEGADNVIVEITQETGFIP